METMGTMETVAIIERARVSRPIPRLRNVRERQSLSQRALAMRAGVNKNVVSRAERGAGVAFATVTRLAAALGVEPATLMAETEETPGLDGLQRLDCDGGR